MLMGLVVTEVIISKKKLRIAKKVGINLLRRLMFMLKIVYKKGAETVNALFSNYFIALTV